MLGVLCMILAPLLGWLPGPGGIPLFVLGLSLLAINHDWAGRYIDKIKDYVENLGEMVFTKDKDVQLAYDIICPLMVVSGSYLLYRHSAPWMVSVGIFLVLTGFSVLIGNRDRWTRLKKRLTKKHKL